jgi:hypothetical protein
MFETTFERDGLNSPRRLPTVFLVENAWASGRQKTLKENSFARKNVVVLFPPFFLGCIYF